MMRITNATHGQLAENRRQKRLVTLRRIRKDGTPGKPQTYERMGGEKTARDVINRLEDLNPGTKWIEA